ncbi:hypothetical protein ARMA_0705 [Ardenticatena maritima]|uniref:VanZ-like domain-containing protein n=1 Tax=Ardenticatena maritima TaxID=872965 RepID=A0A0M8K7F9_9CHLR|nr:VanZ family protein [Ardenticatena maritima]KPL86441.1 hypothetical protein SE16_14210 [Ardenticatena maritima]GAP62282.1 hypothetical protein ARMA_0705 [Ardenticatena maritima]
MNRVRTWGPVLAWMGVIFYLSSQSSVPVHAPGWLDAVDDYVAHVLVYAVLGWLTFRAWRAEGLTFQQAAWATFLLCVAYGVSDEWHQSFVPNRTPSVLDLLADALGVGVALFVHYRKQKRMWQGEW